MKYKKITYFHTQTIHKTLRNCDIVSFCKKTTIEQCHGSGGNRTFFDKSRSDPRIPCENDMRKRFIAIYTHTKLEKCSLFVKLLFLSLTKQKKLYCWLEPFLVWESETVGSNHSWYEKVRRLVPIILGMRKWDGWFQPFLVWESETAGFNHFWYE